MQQPDGEWNQSNSQPTVTIKRYKLMAHVSEKNNIYLI